MNNHFILKSEIILDVNSWWIIARLWNQPAVGMQTLWLKTAIYLNPYIYLSLFIWSLAGLSFKNRFGRWEKMFYSKRGNV